jgi:excisionase family DNA binding protein
MSSIPNVDETPQQPSPWLTVEQAASYANCGARTLYASIRSGALRAVRIGTGRNLRTKREWIDAMYAEAEMPREVSR